MQTLKSFFSIENLSAIFPWAVVTGVVMYLMTQSNRYSAEAIAGTAIALVIYIVCFIVAISDNKYRYDLPLRLVLIAIQYLAVLTAALLAPFGFLAILVTIWSAQLPYFTSFKNTLITSPIWSAPFWIIMYFYWQIDSSVLSALLFWTFNIFALVMVNGNIKEKRATEQAMELNRELMATQALLGEASKQAERVRIARNIHDLLGHHLTALTINLQVAARISEGEAQLKIKQCHDLSKLLLSDVREAVSEIREKSHIKLHHALHALSDNVPNLHIEMELEANLNIVDVNMAEAILRCVQESITNTLKHSDATCFHIGLKQENEKFQLTMYDNGTPKKYKALNEGNGLLGIKERIHNLGGAVKAEFTDNGFRTFIELPELL